MRPLTTLMFCLLSGLMAGQISDWRFTHLTTEDGLPPAIVTDMAQDRLGRMWISTFAGLVCYDGYTCRTFSHNPSDSTSLPGNRIPSITVLQGDSLLACGPGGLVLVNARNETFGQLSARTFDGVDLPQLVYDAYVDAEGLIWMTSDSGVYVLDLTAGTTELFVPISEPADIRERRFNRTIYVRPDVSDHNVLWFSNFTSIVAFDKRTRRFSLYPGPQYTEEWPLEMDQIIDFTTDPDGFVWAARAGRGLTRLDPQTGTWTQYMFNALDDILSFDRNENHLLEIRHLDEHHLLLATRYSGLVLFDKILEQFQRIVHEPGDAKSLMPGRQIALHHDREGRWWIGGEFGISIYDPALNLFQTHPTGFGQWPFFSVLRYDTSRQTLLGCKPTGMYWLGADQDTVLKASGVDQSGDLVKLAGVTDFEILHNGNIWFVTSEEIRSGVSGLFHLDLNAGTGVLLRTSGVDFPLRNLRTILQDSRRRLWIGSDRDGSVMMTPDTLVLFIDPDLKTTDTWYMAEDPQQRVWLTCYEGVRIFEEVNDVLRMRQPELPPGILSAIHQAQGLAIDDQGVVWIGTRYNGLFRIPIADIWQSSQIIEMHGLQLHNIRAVAVQDSIVWLGMNGGLGRLDPRRNNFQLFTDAHGLKHSEIHGLHVGADRRLYIGTRTGVSFAHIDTLARRLSKVPPRIYFKDFSVNGVRESELITGDLQDGFTLEYPLNSFMVTYAAVGFTEPEQQQYAYLLEGADDQFNLAGSRQFTSYNNLDPGRYLLRVKAANSMGYWNEEGAVLPIYVKPAFWQTLG
ncbi:MAG: triple tyrosine motif-containing protein, partial [Saprospiraceae bacterium]|nr:triple tyrosine motif-containing protein [Saprospiraceae bacterium]